MARFETEVSHALVRDESWWCEFLLFRSSAQVAQFQRSPADCGSTEVQIALLSSRVINLTAHLKANKKDYDSQRGLLKVRLAMTTPVSTVRTLETDIFARYITSCMRGACLKVQSASHSYMSAPFSTTDVVFCLGFPTLSDKFCFKGRSFIHAFSM